MTLTEHFVNNGFTRSAAEIAAADVNICLAIMERNGSMKEEAVIGFYQYAKERGLNSNYVKGIINMAKTLYSANH